MARHGSLRDTPRPVARPDAVADPLELPHPSDRSRRVAWVGDGFEVDGVRSRILTYAVAPSGWSEALTRLHETVGGSDHFIDVASRRHAIGEVERGVPASPSLVLEVGCSSGYLLRELVARLPGHRIVGSDYVRETLEPLGRRLPGVPLLQLDLTRCPLGDDFADVVVALNVLEHIADDERAIAELFRIVRPGGAVVIEVPAGPELFDVYDRVLRHHRRYDMRGLVARLEKAGFRIERRSHLGFLLYPVFWLAKRFNRLRDRMGSPLDEQAMVSRMISATRRGSRLMNEVMRWEQALRRHVDLPFGIRCLVTCRKPVADPGADAAAAPPD